MKNYKAHILVVDDDDGIRNLVKKFLNEKNFLVNTASSAEEAQKKISIIKFETYFSFHTINVNIDVQVWLSHLK